MLDSLKSGILTMLLGIFNIVLKSICLLIEDFNIVDSLNYTVFSILQVYTILGFEVSMNKIPESSNIDKNLSASKKYVCYSVLLIKISDFFFSILKNDIGSLGVVTSSTSILYQLVDFSTLHVYL